MIDDEDTESDISREIAARAAARSSDAERICDLLTAAIPGVFIEVDAVGGDHRDLRITLAPADAGADLGAAAAEVRRRFPGAKIEIDAEGEA